jgi:hypothetical protein
MDLGEECHVRRAPTSSWRIITANGLIAGPGKRPWSAVRTTSGQSHTPRSATRQDGQALVGQPLSLKTTSEGWDSTRFRDNMTE